MAYIEQLGRELPSIGFGTANLAEDRAADLIGYAIETGYRLIDTAPVYGSGSAVGEAVRKAAAGGRCRREDLLIETKLSNEDQGYYSTLRALDRSLNKLGLDYIDLYLIHWPIPKDRQLDYKRLNRETWTAMEELRAKGLVRAIGVCNFLPRHIENLISDGGTVPAVNQLELHPEYQERECRAYCVEKRIQVEAWSPFRNGMTFSNEGIKKFAAGRSLSVPELVYSWNKSLGSIPIVKSNSKEHIRLNFEQSSSSKVLSAEDLEGMKAFDSPDAHMDFWNYRRQLAY